MNNLNDMRKQYVNLLNNAKFADRGWAYTALTYLDNGFYSPDEIIDQALSIGFSLDTPFIKIKRGTHIEKGAFLIGNTVIDGENICIGKGTVVENAHISGSNSVFGSNNRIYGKISTGNLNIGNENYINTIHGNNKGTVVIGNNNTIEEITIENVGTSIEIGNSNSLHRNLNINGILPNGKIYIGDFNSLGRDGGGVISNSYRYNKNWWGDVIVGSFVETTRGAEILGFSAIGICLSKQEEENIRKYLIHGSLANIHDWFISVRKNIRLPTNRKQDSVKLFGSAKTKMSCLVHNVQIKEQTRIHNSFLENIIIPERCTVYFTTVQNPEAQIQINTSDIVIEEINITQDMDWKNFPSKTDSEGYRGDEASFYDSENAYR